MDLLLPLSRRWAAVPLAVWLAACPTAPDDDDAEPADAAAPADAGFLPDAAVKPDAAAPADAAVVPDAAMPPDAGSPRDAAVPPDASVVDGATPADAGPALDANLVADAAMPTDAGGGAPDAQEPPDAATADASTAWRSALYPADWTPGFQDDAGRALQDYSYAGYRNGEDPPFVLGPVFPVTEADPAGVLDSTAAIQAALDAAGAAGGGVVELPPGLFRLAGVLGMTASHVVLRGSGAALTQLWFPSVGPAYGSDIQVGQAPIQGPDLLLAQDANRFDTTLLVTNAGPLTVGADIAVGHVISDAFIQDHGMAGVWTTFRNTWQPIYRRTVRFIDTSVTPHRVTLDVPLRDGLLIRDGASIRQESGLLAEVGIEELALGNAVTSAQAWSVNQVHLLTLDGVKDSWVRHVQSFETQDGAHLQSCGLLVADSKRVTVSGTTLAQAQNRGGGGNGYLFELRQSSEVLFQDDVGRAGRHNFIQNWGFGTNGCVFLRCHSRDGRNLMAAWDPLGAVAMSEFHHSLATANLIDSSTLDDGWVGANRGTESSGAGHSASENAFWNTRGAGVLISVQWGFGYVVGTQGVQVTTDPAYWSLGQSGSGTAPEDFREGVGLGATLEPQSLYLDQRARRLAHP